MQAMLPGLAPAAATDRLFLAIYPDRDTIARIAALTDGQRARHGMPGTPVSPDRLHVTLFHLGDFAGLRQDIVDAATKAAARMKAAPFDVTFDAVANFGQQSGNSLLVLKSGATDGNATLRAFRERLGSSLLAAGVVPADLRHFEPHVTLIYNTRIIEQEAIAPISWCVGEFVLVHSLLGRTRHIHLARWPLDGA